MTGDFAAGKPRVGLVWNRPCRRLEELSSPPRTAVASGTALLHAAGRGYWVVRFVA